MNRHHNAKSSYCNYVIVWRETSGIDMLLGLSPQPSVGDAGKTTTTRGQALRERYKWGEATKIGRHA